MNTGVSRFDLLDPHSYFEGELVALHPIDPPCTGGGVGEPPYDWLWEPYWGSSLLGLGNKDQTSG